MLKKTRQSPPLVLYSKIRHPCAGWLLLGQTKDGWLCRVSFVGKTGLSGVLNEWRKEWPETRFVRGANRPARTFSLTGPQKLWLIGTPFQCKVWTTLLTIGKGKTISYGTLARRIGHPNAFRAVGTALGKNPLAVILPCHRVIAGNGTLGGFSSGLKLKAKLLEFENETN